MLGLLSLVCLGGTVPTEVHRYRGSTPGHIVLYSRAHTDKRCCCSVLCAALPQPSLSSGAGPLARWRGSTRSAVPHLAAIFQLSDCLVVCLAVCFSVLQCPGTCSQPYLTNLPSSPSTPLVTPSRLWRRLADYKHSSDLRRVFLLILSGRPQPPDLRRKTALC